MYDINICDIYIYVIYIYVYHIYIYIYIYVYHVNIIVIGADCLHLFHREVFRCNGPTPPAEAASAV